MKIKRAFTMLLIMLLLVCAGCSVSNDSDESSEKLTLFQNNNVEGLAGDENSSTELNSDALETEKTDDAIEENIQELPIPSDCNFEVHYIDVGQADATLVMCDGEYMLIDGGNVEDSSLIYAYLKEYQISELEYMICTHAHEDHVGGLAGALNYAQVQNVFCPTTYYDTDAFRSFIKYVNQQNKEIVVPTVGTSFSLGSASCTILAVNTIANDPNNSSIVLRIDYGKTSFLFCGDAEQEVETKIIEAGYDVSCTVMKVPHHGSDTSLSYRWLNEAMPEYGVISVGENNQYGHPCENTLSKLRDADVQVYRTDMQGHIICVSNGSNVSFSVQKNLDIDTLADSGPGTKMNNTDIQESDNTEIGDQIKYILNVNTKKIHYPSCSSVIQMKDKNKQETALSREELISQGYTPCGRCKP